MFCQPFVNHYAAFVALTPLTYSETHTLRWTQMQTVRLMHTYSCVENTKTRLFDPCQETGREGQTNQCCSQKRFNSFVLIFPFFGESATTTVG